jgi:ABC-type bacteriocin/lantibiotic exporter with double-glycine peptidase domain
VKFIAWPSPLRKTGRTQPLADRNLPNTLVGFLWKVSAGDQVWLCALSIATAILDTVPIEAQRRIINAAVKQGDFHKILLLAAVYAGLVITQGSVKLLRNLYRGWVGEHATWALRTLVNDLSHHKGSLPDDATAHGIEISMIISECDAVGGFVGDGISEPLLQAGTMVSVISYLVYLQPLMVLIVLAVLLPQFVFVPLMQLSINKKARARIATLRGASAEIVADKVDSDEMLLSHHQHQRFSRVFELNMRIYRLKFSMNFLMNLTHQLGVAVILCTGGWFVVSGKTQIGTVVAFVSGLATVKDPWSDLVAWFQNLMVTTARYQLIFDAIGKISGANRSSPNRKAFDAPAPV